MRYKVKTNSRVSTTFKINCSYLIKDTQPPNKETLSYGSQACVDPTFTEVDNEIAENQSLVMKVATTIISTRYRRINLKDHLSTHMTMMMISKQEIKSGLRPLNSVNRISRLNGAVADQ